MPTGFIFCAQMNFNGFQQFFILQLFTETCILFAFLQGVCLEIQTISVRVCVCYFLVFFLFFLIFWHDICLSTEAVYQTENVVPTLSLSMGVDDFRQ